MRRAILGTLTIILLLDTSAIFSKEPWKDSEGKTYTYQEIGSLATKEVLLSWRPEGWKEITFAPNRNGYLGMTFIEKKEIAIWIRPEHSPTEVAATIVHELGHSFDCEYFESNLEYRAKWLEIRGLPKDTPWFPEFGSGKSDNNTGAGDFAESVAWTFQGPTFEFDSKLGPPPNKKQQKLIRGWFETLPQQQKQKFICLEVKKPKGLAVYHHKYQEIRSGEVVYIYKIEICKQPQLFWENVPENKVMFSNPCTGMR